MIETVIHEMTKMKDQEIAKSLGVEDHKPEDLHHNPLQDLKDMVAKMGIVIMCSENDTKKLEERELPGTVAIIPGPGVPDGQVFMLKDERLKRIVLDMIKEKRKGEASDDQRV